MTPTLGRYIRTIYGRSFLATAIGLMIVVYLFEAWEMVRRGAGSGADTIDLIGLAFFKLPATWNVIAPFVFLFAGLHAFWLLARQGELVVLRASGLSAWNFIRPMVMMGLVLGVIHVAVLNPLGAAMLSRFEQVENTVLRSGGDLVSLLQGGLWLRQNDEQAGNGYALLHAEKIDPTSWVLTHVMTLSFTNDHQFVERIDAPRAQLTERGWILENSVVNSRTRIAEMAGDMVLPTRLTGRDIEDRFASPETISVWELPNYIRTLEATGFDSLPTRVHLIALLTDPLLFAAMVLLAACVAIDPVRGREPVRGILMGIGVGFAIFFGAQFAEAMGRVGQIPPLVAAGAVPVLAILLALSVLLLKREDG